MRYFRLEVRDGPKYETLEWRLNFDPWTDCKHTKLIHDNQKVYKNTAWRRNTWETMQHRPIKKETGKWALAIELMYRSEQRRWHETLTHGSHKP